MCVFSSLVAPPLIRAILDTLYRRMARRFLWGRSAGPLQLLLLLLLLSSLHCSTTQLYRPSTHQVAGIDPKDAQPRLGSADRFQ